MGRRAVVLVLVPLVACGELLGVGGDGSSTPPPAPPSGQDAGDAGVDAREDAPPSDAGVGVDVEVVSMCPATGLCTISENEPNAYGIAVDADHVYWTLQVHDVGAVRRWSKTTGVVETFQAGLDQPNGVAAGPNDVYWTLDGPKTGTGGAVQRKPKTPAGAALTTLDMQSNPRAIVADDSRVAWAVKGTNPGTGAVRSAAVDLSSPIENASGLNGPLGVAMDATSLYSASAATTANVLKLGKASTMQTDSAVQMVLANGFAVGSGNLFVMSSTGVSWMSLASFNNAAIVLDPTASVGGIAADAQDVYWVTGSYVRSTSASSPNNAPNLTTTTKVHQQVAIDATRVYWTWRDITGTQGGVYAYPR